MASRTSKRGGDHSMAETTASTGVSSMFWNGPSIRLFLKNPVRLAEPYQMWIKKHGGQSKVRKYLQSQQMSEDQHKLLMLLLDYPDSPVTFHASELGISQSTYFPRKKQLDEYLAYRLNDWTGDASHDTPRSLTIYGAAPVLPRQFNVTGRTTNVDEIKRQLDDISRTGGDTFTPLVVHGWPGVGKTTCAAALVHAANLGVAFPDGVLWISLGPEPDLLSKLVTCGHSLDLEGISTTQTVEQAVVRLRARLRDKRMLVVVDDVWEAQDAITLSQIGNCCTFLLTTRSPKVGQDLNLPNNQLYKLSVLNTDQGLALLRALATATVAEHLESSIELVKALEGLPLALQVAGRLLNTETSYEWGVVELLKELRDDSSILLDAEAPPDPTFETPLTVKVLFQKSTDRLDQKSRDCFARLGPFTSEPATFDLKAMQAVWHMDDPRPVIRKLVGRGLLEPIQSGRFQMHALLVQHARFLLKR